MRIDNVMVEEFVAQRVSVQVRRPAALARLEHVRELVAQQLHRLVDDHLLVRRDLIGEVNLLDDLRLVELDVPLLHLRLGVRPVYLGEHLHVFQQLARRCSSLRRRPLLARRSARDPGPVGGDGDAQVRAAVDAILGFVCDGVAQHARDGAEAVLPVEDAEGLRVVESQRHPAGGLHHLEEREDAREGEAVPPLGCANLGHLGLLHGALPAPDGHGGDERARGGQVDALVTQVGQETSEYRVAGAGLRRGVD
mmetsp:Transcript_30539/g.76486  ORF Transcript_30539/g.76486 Transcript_30539/m.76486 type:complete len:252 (+) Transcript_30539:401-1156(+)